MEVVCLKIHQTRRFAKRLVAMVKAGKHERIVAERARQIFADLQTNPLHEEAECKRTRHGELRLNDCRKYDLSCGFRLIALKRDRRLIFTYIGSHDDCQRWIENNRDYLDEIESAPVPLIDEEERQQSEVVIGVGPDHDEYEEQLREEIDERVLREIFSGLCNNG
ncbi:MAG: hypothetical protein NTY00_06400 [Deltaproteobacteria bacterium]|nr:hypothetical protein [Deltaproteobacteria bacterium]